LEPEEFTRLKAYSALHFQTINLCAYQTGMWLGEILGLTWKRVDFQAGLIQLQAEVTKTEDARLIPLTVELTEMLKDFYKVRYLYLDEQKVFLVKGLPVGSIKIAFNGACARVGGLRVSFPCFPVYGIHCYETGGY
jgi:integrase